MTQRHDYECECDQCRAMFAAIEARLPNGEYFFTDEELMILSGAVGEGGQQ